jgi:hypothetical protein
VPEFVKLLSQVPGAEFPRPRTREGEAIRELEVLGRLAVDEEVGIELVHLPGHEDYAAFWPLAGHGALGTIFLLRGAMSEEARRIQPIAQVLARLPRARTFHVVLLAKQDRIAPDELRENLALIDEASLFLLPLEGRREPLALLRTLFTRVLP